LEFDIGTFKSVWRLRDLEGQVIREIRLDNGAGIWSWQKDWIRREGQPLAAVDAVEGTRHLHPDHLGTTRAITDASGTHRSTYHFDPYGEMAASFSAGTEVLLYTGHERDDHALTGGNSGTTDDLDYMHARYYNPTVGRFLHFDSMIGNPIEPKSWNAYIYARSNPLAYVDPDGRDPLDVIRGGYKFHIDLRQHGGPHVDVFERQRGSWRKLGRVRLPELTPIKHKGKIPRIPKKAMKFLKGFVRGAGLVGAVMTVMNAEAANEDEDLVLMVQEDLANLAAARGLDLSTISEEEFIELLDAVLMPDPETSTSTDVQSSGECDSAGSFNASEDPTLCQ